MHARIQQIDDQVLGAAFFIDADMIAPFITLEQERIEYMPEATSDGILLRIGGDRT